MEKTEKLLKDFLQKGYQKRSNVHIVNHSFNGHICDVTFTECEEERERNLDVNIWDVLAFVNEELCDSSPIR